MGKRKTTKRKTTDTKTTDRKSTKKTGNTNIVNNNLDKLNKLKDQYPLVKNALNETLGKNNILNSFMNEVKIYKKSINLYCDHNE